MNNDNHREATLKEGDVFAYFDEDGTLVEKENEPFFYRQFLGQDPEGHFIVQDLFVRSNRAFSSPITLKSQDAFMTFSFCCDPQLSEPFLMHIEGPFTLWHENGQKFSEWTYHDGIIGETQKVWHENGRMASFYQATGDAYCQWDEDGEVLCSSENFNQAENLEN